MDLGCWNPNSPLVLFGPESQVPKTLHFKGTLASYEAKNAGEKSQKDKWFHFRACMGGYLEAFNRCLERMVRCPLRGILRGTLREGSRGNFWDPDLFSRVLPSCLPPLLATPLPPFSRHLSALFSPSKSALFCRAKGIAQSLEHKVREGNSFPKSVEPKVLQSGFGMIFFNLAWRILGKVPANFSANSDS